MSKQTDDLMLAVVLIFVFGFLVGIGIGAILL